MAFAVEKLLGVLDTLNLAANTPTQDENYKKGRYNDVGAMRKSV